MKIELYDSEEDCTDEYELPSKFEVCPTCRGTSTIMNPNIGLVFREEFDNDSQFFEDYRFGVYNIECPECKGVRVIEIVDESKLNSEQKKIFTRYREMERECREFNRKRGNENWMQERMCSGW